MIAGNVIAGWSVGVKLLATNASADGSTVDGNYIGTNESGMAALPNGIGILITNLPGLKTTKGTVTGNVLSGNGTGVSIVAANGSTISKNFIGLAADGILPLGNLNDGVQILDSSSNYIGPLYEVQDGNMIAYNGGAGVSVSSSSSGNRVLGNSIFANGSLGIDLNPAGVALNDAGDADTGANNLQNFPVITSVRNEDGNTSISGTLNSMAGTTFRLEFFGNDKVNSLGFGEGRYFLGFTDVTTDASGNAAFDLNFPAVPGAPHVTATATDPDGNTSEFSAAIGQPLNISTRLRVQAGDNVLIGGFIITGSDPKRVLVRGIGPSLASSGVQDSLADPTLELHDVAGTLATNDNWKTRPDGSSQQAEIEATTIPPTNDLESAIVATLPANNASYTAIVRGEDNRTGIALVEAYDLDPAANSRLANISTRGLVETGNNVLIGGFIAGNGLTKVIVRAIGPTLSNAGITNPLPDPTLELHDGNGATLRSNDNWKLRPDGTSQQAEIEATTIPPTDDRESAIVQTLAPGNYTAIVRGKSNTTGIAVVEVYNIP